MKRRSSIVFLIALVLAITSIAQAGSLITLDIRDLDIYDVARLLSTQSSVNIVVDASVAHRPVTLRLQRVSFEEALSALVQSNDLAVARAGKVLYLGTPEAINRRYATTASGNRTRTFAAHNLPSDVLGKQLADTLGPGTLVVSDRRSSGIIVSGSQTSLDRAADLVGLLDRAADPHSQTFALHFLKAGDAAKALLAMLAVVPPAAIYAIDQQNAVVATGSSEFIARTSELLDRIDRPGQQVRYEVRVTDISPSTSSNVGILFGGLSLGGQPVGGQATTAFLTNSIALNATINALVTQGDAAILAQPSLSTLNNVQASLLVGQQFPIVYFDARTGTQQVQFTNIGVNLSVLPSIGTDGVITTDLETDYSTIVNFVNGFPVIGTRRAQSTLRVHDGETIVIAGLFQDLDTKTLSKVPFLADIPLFGELFKNRVKEHVRDEVVFLITPHLVVDREHPAAQ